MLSAAKYAAARLRISFSNLATRSSCQISRSPGRSGRPVFLKPGQLDSSSGRDPVPSPWILTPAQPRLLPMRRQTWPISDVQLGQPHQRLCDRNQARNQDAALSTGARNSRNCRSRSRISSYVTIVTVLEFARYNSNDFCLAGSSAGGVRPATTKQATE